jgi:hypothetical protein
MRLFNVVGGEKMKKIITTEEELKTKAINFLGDEKIAEDFIRYIKEKPKKR